MSSRTHRGFAQFRKLLLGSVLLAANATSSAAITVTEVVTPSLGTWFSGAPGRQFILNTDETVGGANAADYLFGAVSGQLEILGENADVNILTDNIIPFGGVTASVVPCRFQADPQTTCEGAGINVPIKKNLPRTLYVGVDLTTSQVHIGGDTASVTYDITVTLI